MVTDGCSTATNLSLSVFFPCYNEEATVQDMTTAALAVCAAIAHDFEVIIIDDGSTDGTGSIADRLAAQHPEVRAVHNCVNSGYGGALRRGFAEARKEWVFYTDGDGQFDLRDLPILVSRLAQFDIVAGYRIVRRDHLMRKINAWCWNRLISLLFRGEFRDIDCAFKVFPRSLFSRIRLQSTGAMIDAEVMLKAVSLGYRVGWVEVHHYARTAGQATGARFSVIARALYELARLYREIGPLRSRAGSQLLDERREHRPTPPTSSQCRPHRSP